VTLSLLLLIALDKANLFAIVGCPLRDSQILQHDFQNLSRAPFIVVVVVAAAAVAIL